MVFVAILAVVILLVSLGVIVLTQPQGKHTSFSVHAASREWSYWLFGVTLTICGTLFGDFLVTLGPKVGAPVVFTIAAILGWICTLLTAWIPDKTGEISIRNPHWIVSAGLAFMMTVMIGALAFATKLSVQLRVIAGAFSVWYLFTLYLGIFIKQSRQYFLVFQIINVVSFFTILIISATVS